MNATGESLPDNWLLTTIGEVGAIRLGRQRSPANTTGRFPVKYIRAANITPRGFDLTSLLEMDFTPQERSIYRLSPGDILLAEGSGSPDQVGRAAIWRDQIPECCYQNTVIRFRPHATTSEYALIVFRHLRISGVFGQAARGGGIRHLGASRLAELPFPLPPLREQAQISDRVEHYSHDFSGTEDNLRSELETLKEQDLKTLEKVANGRLLHPDLDTTSEHPEAAIEMPHNWRSASIGNIAQVRLGRMKSPQNRYGHNMRPYLRVANVLEDQIDSSDIMEMNFSPEEYEKYALHPGDILLNDGQSPELVGRPAIYRGEVPGACYQNHLIRFRAGPDVDPEFAVLVFRHYLHSGIFRAAARWTTNIATLSLKRFSELSFPLPPLHEQARIVQEARQRLRESARRQVIVKELLNALPEKEAELLSRAVSGTLVPPDESSESAAELLNRMGKPPAERAAPRPLSSSPRVKEGPHMPQNSGRSRRSPRTSLSAVLLSRHGDSIPLPELFRLAGFDKDKPSDVEEFYVELRDELGRSIRISSEEQENAMVEAAHSEDN